MREDTYWDMIERSRARGRGGLLKGLLGRGGGEQANERQLDALRTKLEGMLPEEVKAFKVWLDEQMERANLWTLWVAAYVMCGGCSDDGFEYFRAWLIAQGRAVFERALADPESLADLRVSDPEEECEFESLLYLPVEVYEGMTGQDLYEALPERAGAGGPRGEPFDEDTVLERHPRLAAKWGG